jgi:hypothetical protein
MMARNSTMPEWYPANRRLSRSSPGDALVTMLRQGPISLTLHSLLEPVIAALLIAAPFLFGFSDEGAPTAVSIVIGIGVLVVGMSTRWRLSLVKAIPVSVHLTIDLIVGALLIASPFLFGFSDETEPTAVFIGGGIIHLLVSIGTRYRREEVPERGTPKREQRSLDRGVRDEEIPEFEPPARRES